MYSLRVLYPVPERISASVRSACRWSIPGAILDPVEQPTGIARSAWRDAAWRECTERAGEAAGGVASGGGVPPPRSIADMLGRQCGRGRGDATIVRRGLESARELDERRLAPRPSEDLEPCR